ncbi:MAG: oligopeptide transporter, OPT family, partial [Planctomycetes bacterium]|nr:oligopeptide transporter, OPT family [Planctomycetota bacterium]
MSELPPDTTSGPDANADSGPYIPASQSLPEITIKAVVLGVLLSVLLAGANAYLGLKAGMTVSASIPAAVISMAVLRLFRRSNILENNIVQTAASAGESLAAGVIFTLPGLIVLGAWTEFNYWQTTVIAALGGMIGVLFTIPLRRALIVEQPLKFPEGVATAEVLKVGDKGGKGILTILLGGAVGALFKMGDSGLRIWTGVVEGGMRAGNSIVYFGTNTAPALLAVGYIVGINIAVLVFLGGAINWYAAIPYVAATSEWPLYESAETVAQLTTEDPDSAWRLFTAAAPDQIGEPVPASDWANTIWSKRTRYLGVGAMVLGGLWALLRLWKSVFAGVHSGIRAYRAARRGDAAVPARTELDTPMHFVGIALMVCAIPLFFVFEMATGSVGISAVMSVIMLIAGFLFSAVASYMAGLVGSSNNPISGMTIATLLTSALLLLALGMDSVAGPAAAIMIGGVVACAAAIGGDNMQDLKAGRILGATPYKQQIMQAVGVLAAAVIMAPVLTALLKAYGIGPIKIPGRESEALEAPQASLMESVASGVFGGGLPWDLVYVGMALAAAVIAIDVILEKRGSTFRTPVLAVAVGIYLPLELSVPILLGGLVSWVAHRFHMRHIAAEAAGELKSSLQEAKKAGERNGLLLAAGLITGEALLGILLAIPLAWWEGENKLAD